MKAKAWQSKMRIAAPLHSEPVICRLIVYCYQRSWYYTVCRIQKKPQQRKQKSPPATSTTPGHPNHQVAPGFQLAPDNPQPWVVNHTYRPIGLSQKSHTHTSTVKLYCIRTHTHAQTHRPIGLSQTLHATKWTAKKKWWEKRPTLWISLQ